MTCPRTVRSCQANRIGTNHISPVPTLWFRRTVAINLLDGDLERGTRNALIGWNTLSNAIYHVQSSDLLNGWMNRADPFLGRGGATNSVPKAAERFLAVRMQSPYPTVASASPRRVCNRSWR